MFQLDQESYIYLVIIAIGLLVFSMGAKQRKKRRNENTDFRRRYQDRKKEEEKDRTTK
ncbi:hypothetical protein [Zunongwangia sp. HGR-M22]|uniref:hypothetical protein n=1 Tax=Zunongwangia sp. HGR-M22 TaxID=3015168 RepID=UPI0022DE528E|nr:hypothetical protein [Zunongwangia sp. HGR-M22]WBL24879.1 hypothetical protein PBT91_13325 [Zunongwangia sp. HGR-M22]